MNKAVHVKLNVISRTRKLDGFVQVAFTRWNMLIRAGRGVSFRGNRSDQVVLEYF